MVERQGWKYWMFGEVQGMWPVQGQAARMQAEQPPAFCS